MAIIMELWLAHVSLIRTGKSASMTQDKRYWPTSHGLDPQHEPDRSISLQYMTDRGQRPRGKTVDCAWVQHTWGDALECAAAYTVSVIETN